MSIQLSTAIRNARLDAIETVLGTSPIMTLRSGAQPANCAAANGGTVVATINLPSDWMSAASGGAKAMLGTWEDTAADNSGTVAHFRIHDSTGTTCGMQGSVTLTGGGGDLTLDAVVVNAGQDIKITSFSLTDANA